LEIWKKLVKKLYYFSDIYGRIYIVVDMDVARIELIGSYLECWIQGGSV